MYLLQKEGRILTGHEAFLKRIGSCFAKFVDEKVHQEPYTLYPIPYTLYPISYTL